MTRTLRKNQEYKKKAKDGKPRRGCGDKKCKLCAENRQNKKIKEKANAKLLLQESRRNTMLRSDGRVEWLCEHGIGHTISIPYQWIKLIRDDKLTSTIAFSHGCDGCCVGRKENDP